MKRIISFVLCLSMLLSMLPMGVFAAELEEATAVTETLPAEESTAAQIETTEATEASVPETTELPEESVPETTAAEVTVETLPEATQPAQLEEAVPEETEETIFVETFTWVPTTELPSDEALFAGYVDQQFYGGTATFGTAGREKLSDALQPVYDALAKQIKKIASGDLDSSVIAVGQHLGDLTFTDDGNSVTYPCNVEAGDEIDVRNVDLDLQLMLDVLLEDFPYDLYWFDKTWGVHCAYLSNNGKGCYVFYFYVSADYSATGEEFTTDLDTGLTGAASLAVANAQALVEELQDSSDYDKLAGYADYIIDHVSYNQSAAYDPTTPYGDPWQMIWVFDDNTSTNVVCEGYSKAFQYLCDQSDFDNDILCYSVTGYLNPKSTNPGAHMWNVLRINENSYLVDVTNCDTFFDLFLQGGPIRKGAYYYVYTEDSAIFTYDADTYGTYIFDKQTFVYDKEQTLELWGEEVLTLATERLTEDNFPTVEESTIMTGEEFSALLAGSASEITVSKALTIENSVTIPEGKTVTITSPGSVTVAGGASLTILGSMEFPGTGLTVQSGGSLTLKGSGRLGFYGVSALTIESGATYAVLDEAEIYANQGTVLTGITKGEVCNSNMVQDTGTGLEVFLANCGAADYKTFYLNIEPNYTVSNNTTLPENVAVDNYGNTFTVADGGTLTVNGSWTVGMDAGVETVAGHIVVEAGGTLVLNGPMELLYGSTLTIESGATLVNASEITVDAASRLTNNGTIENAGSINGTVSGSGTVTEPAMTGEELVELLENQTGVQYTLLDRVVIDSDIVLPEINLFVWGNGSITVKDGGSLTFSNTLDVANGGSLTVEAGGALTVNGVLCAAGGGTVDIRGSHILGDDSWVVLNYPGTISGIEASHIHYYAPVWNEESLLDAVGYQGYATSELIIPGSDLDQDGNPDPVVLTKDLTIPEGWTFVIGDELGIAASVQVSDGVTLTNNGTVSIWPNASLYLGEDAALNGSGQILNDGTITSYGTIAGTVEGNGTVSEYMSQSRFQAFLDGADAELTVSKPLTLTGTFIVPEGKYVYFENPGCLAVAEGAKLTVEGAMEFPGSSLTVQTGGSLTLMGQGSLGFNGASALTIEAGAAYEILGEAEIYANMGTILTGITKGEVCNSTFLENPEDNLQEIAESGAGYRKYYVTLYTDYVISQDMTLPANVVLEQFGRTVTITSGATLTVNGSWELGMETPVPYVMQQISGHIVIEDGKLVTNGSLKLKHGSTMTVAQSGSYTSNGSFSLDVSSAVTNQGFVQLNGTQDLDGTWSGEPAQSQVYDSQYFFELELQKAAAEGRPTELAYSLELSRSLHLNCPLTIAAGAVLTVPKGITLYSNSQITLENGAALDVQGTLTGRLPALMGSDAAFDYSDGTVAFTQTDLDAQLQEADGAVYISIPLTLTRDLTVPAGAQLILTGDGSITIPAERTLRNSGHILLQYPTKGISGIVNKTGGTIVNTGVIRNEGRLDLSEGVYECSEDAELIMVRLSTGDTPVNYTLICDEDLYQHITILVEGWDIAQLYDVLQRLDSVHPPKVLQINVCGDLTLNNADFYGTNWELPEYTSLYIGDLGYGDATLTVASGHTLLNNGSTEIGAGGKLSIEKGATLKGSLPVCLEGGQYINGNEKLLTGKLANTKLTGPAKVTGTLEIPAGVTLTISGSSASLVLDEGAELINNGTIVVEKDGILDATQGTYTGSSTVNQLFHCDAAGNVTRAAILGIDPALVHFTAETASDDLVIREAIAYVDALVENGSISNPEERGFFAIRFVGDTVLSADLELPYYSDPIITGTGSLTVPEGMTLTDHSGMDVAGTLIAEGQVIATGFPMAIIGEDCLVNPENCTNFYFDNLPLEAIAVTADRDTAAVGDAIALNIDGWTPEHAKYFGDYEVSFDIEGFDGKKEDGSLLVYANPELGACDVTVTITATDESGEVLFNSAGEPICESVLLHFLEKQLSLWVTENPDFWENAENGICGLYPGGSLTYYANTTGLAGEVDRSITWPDYSDYSEYITTRVEDGMLTVTAKTTMPGMTVIDIQPMTEDPAVVPYSEPLVLRPKAASVDILMDVQTVTGKTVQVDVNREGPIQLALAPMATPVDAYSEYLASAGTALVQWKSDKESIATVDGNGNVTFTGATGKVKITMTTNFGVKKTASVTFNAVKLAQSIVSSESNAEQLIGGSSATYTVYDATDLSQKALKSSAVTWFLCDKDGNPIDSHPYASVTAAGKLTTKAISDEINVYLMAQVVGNEDARLSEPVLVELYPAVGSVQIQVGTTPISGTLLYDTNVLGDLYPLSWSVGPYLESVKEVSWKSSATKIATIDKDTGLINVLKSGTAKFTLTVTALNNKKTTATVTMKFGVFTRDLDLSARLPGSDEPTDALDYLTIYSGEAITFSAQNVPTNVTTSGVKWSVDNKTAASITSAGKLTAKTVTAPVIVTVLAESKDGSPEGIYTIDVLILPKQSNDMEAMVLYTGDADDGYTFLTKTTRTLAPSETLQVYASDFADWNDDADGFEIYAAEDVEWVSSKASVATVDEDGLITAVAAGTAKITATDAFGRTAYFSVKVSKSSVDVEISQKKTGITSGLSVASGKSLDLMGTVTYTDDSTDTKVNWSVSDTSLATISASGKLTAAKNLTKPATVTVWAYAKDGNALSFDSINVRILPLTTGVEIFGTFGGSYKDISNTTQKQDLTTQSDTFTLSAKTFPEGAMGVTWKSSNAKIASVDPNSGKVTCLKAGTVTITATAADGSGKKATFKLTVHRTMQEDSLTLPETAIIGGGKSLTMTKLEGYSIDSDATNKTLAWTLTYPDGTAVPKTVASISAKGVLTTKKITAPLTLCIQATATDGSACAASCFVTIYPLTTKVSITNAPKELTLNGTWDLNAESTPASGANQFTWTTSNSKIATVHPQTGVVKARGVGTVTITATANDGSGKKASVKIKVVPVAFTVFVETMSGDISSHTFTSSEPYLMDALLEEKFVAGEYYYQELGGSLHTAFDINMVNGIPDGQNCGFVWACRYYGTHYTNSFSGIDLGQLEIVPGGMYLFWPSEV